MLKGKKVVIFGERDDVHGAAIEICMKAAGAEIVQATTACFV